ncbi:MAG: cytochrome P450 [Burkholderiales bacterium]|nr:MAG: cytochrome P450 [Burkholderiales bacterium]
MPASRWDPWIDRSLALRADPYRFISRTCREAGRDAVELRLLGRRTVVMTGARAVSCFGDAARFERAGAVPEPLRATLFGKGGQQSLDGSVHAARKALFLALLAPPTADRLVTRFVGNLERAARDWAQRDAVPLHEALQPVLARTVCDWAGVVVPADMLSLRTAQLASLYMEPLTRHLHARGQRRAAEGWLIAEIDAMRAGRIGGRGEALRAIAMHVDPRGAPLSARIAAVEMLNLLRPTVAVAVWIVFAAHALVRAPAWRDALRVQPSLIDCFVQEVRRFYPFFPMVAARVRRGFEWDGVRFATGRRALLDLYGTGHDPRCWDAPERFRPERFLQGPPEPPGFVPQGGGDPGTGHRCPGETVAVELTKAATLWLVDGVRYEVPKQDLELDMTRLPALPRGGFTVTKLRPR